MENVHNRKVCLSQLSDHLLKSSNSFLKSILVSFNSNSKIGYNRFCLKTIFLASSTVIHIIHIASVRDAESIRSLFIENFQFVRT